MNPYFMLTIPVLSFFGFLTLIVYPAWRWQKITGALLAGTSLVMTIFLPQPLAQPGYTMLFIAGLICGVAVGAGVPQKE